MPFLTRQNFSYRLQQLVLFVLHLILLKWMFYALNETGSMSTVIVMMHFLGMSTYGALLIVTCAKWAKWHYEKEIIQDHDN
jgi:apolipoprotein N-acyltransferase